MKPEDLSIGMPIIINHFDRPCSRLVAIVTQIDRPNRLVVARYLAASLKGREVMGTLESVTSVAQFRRELSITWDGFYSALHNGTSGATYHDGAIREWQEETPAWIKADTKVLKLAREGQKEEEHDAH